ncbi:hypothetical protein Fbal_1123 [Ferrimonas balearica DSM 9799]|uniref:Uncharacterized protein n=1 Tax=Ferrimonas balearica (strain DSM 9799 / CCM 4581 / KCTC 23876 / PAT) TaxID=550540 RepID=E1SVI6_FERBD|nr:hypothetical protein Fbal_1123 [Ferrimonas balearica DSM 9799]
MLIDVLNPIPTTYQAQIDNECDALAMVMCDEVFNVTPEEALRTQWTLHETPHAAESCVAGGCPCIISQTLGVYATA